MAYKEVLPMDLREIIRRFQSGQNISQISESLGRDRKTIRKYLKHLEDCGIKPDEVNLESEDFTRLLFQLTDEVKRSADKQNIFEPHLKEIKGLLEDKASPLKPKSAFRVITQRHDLSGKTSYSSFKRFVNSHSHILTKGGVTCRIETPPGEQLQVDYAKVGMLKNPKTGKKRGVYSFIGTLSHSRHKFVEFVHKQDQRSFAESHVKMFRFFGGVPRTIVIDNLKSGVIKTDLYDPILNRSYAEVAEYYNTFIDPARVSRPKDKPKVERDVQTIREEFRVMFAMNENLNLEEANLKIKDFLLHEYGMRKHGTTHEEPIKVFNEVEKEALLELPKEEFVVCQWKQAKVHPDCFIQINKKSYSLPYEFIGKTVQVKVKSKIIEVYHKGAIIKVHGIPKNNRQIDFTDFPENIQKAIDGSHPLYLQKEAEKLGGNNLRTLVKNMLTPHAYINRRRAQSIIYIAGKHPKNIIEQAAASALLRQRNPHPNDFKKIIEAIYTEEESTDEGILFSEETKSFTRDINYFMNN